MDAGVLVFAGGFSEEVSVVAIDGTVTDAPKSKAYVGGATIVDVPSRRDALEWAAKIAVACRCAQEFHEILPRARRLATDRQGGRMLGCLDSGTMASEGPCGEGGHSGRSSEAS